MNIEEKMDNFFKNESHRFVREFSEHLKMDSSQKSNFRIKSTDLILISKRDLYTDPDGYFIIDSYLSENAGADLGYILKKCCEIGDLLAVTYLVKCDVCLDDSSYLYLSAKYGHFEIVKYLVENNALFDRYVFGIAAECGHLEIIKYLTIKFPQVDPTEAIFESAYNNHLLVLKYLTKKFPDDNTEFALERSAARGHFEIVKFLAESGTVINKYVLFFAAENGHFEIVKYLINFGVPNNSLAISASATNGYSDIVKFLVESGADPANVCICGCASNGHFDIVKFLVEAGAKNIDTYRLSKVAASGNFEIFKYLVENCVNNANINLSSSLIESIKGGYYDIVKYLVESGTKINTRKCSFAIMDACKAGYVSVVKYLVDAGAKYYIADAFVMSIQYQHHDLIKFFIKKGAIVKDHVISRINSKTNRILYIHSSDNQEYLFNPEIVSELKNIKLLLK